MVARQFAFLTLVSHGALIVCALSLLIPAARRWWRQTLTQHARWLVFVIPLGATLGSLALSEIALLAPCDLCWYQRIVMYPQAIIAGLALFGHNAQLRRNLLVFSGIGIVIAVYHIFLQLGVHEVIPCSARAVAVPCNEVLTRDFGYITIPVMSLTTFVLQAIVAMFIGRRTEATQ